MNVKKIITQFYTINLFHLLFLPFNHKTLLLNTYVVFFKFKVIFYPFFASIVHKPKKMRLSHFLNLNQHIQFYTFKNYFLTNMFVRV